MRKVYQLYHRPLIVTQKRWLALYLVRHRRSRRGLRNRLRKVMFPRARKAGQIYPSIRPSSPDIPRLL